MSSPYEVSNNNVEERNAISDKKECSLNQDTVILSDNINGIALKQFLENGDGKFVQNKVKEPEKSRGKLFRNINRSLLKLKISLFLFFGAGSCIAPFFQVYFIQRGLTISQLSIINVINPTVQFLGPTLSGLIADKTGKSKPVLLANLVLATLFLNCMLFVPNANNNKCSRRGFTVDCPSNLTIINGFKSWEIRNTSLTIHSCTKDCKLNSSINSDDLCHPIMADPYGIGCQEYVFESLNFSIIEEDSLKNNGTCSYEVLAIFPSNSSMSWCKLPLSQHCNLSCELDDITSEECHQVKDKTMLVFASSLVLMVLFGTVFSNCYRFMDITMMSMVKLHNSDLGRERFWCILSACLVSPLAGYLVGVTSPESGPKNISTAFYMFDGFIVLAMISMWHLDVKINPPGKRMWKKSLMLLKDIDVFAFTITLLVLGTSWGFTKTFSYVYLDQLNASSLLLGLIPFLGSLLGMPFLLTSNFFVNKIGSANLLLLGLIAYVCFCIVYSFLINPWYALCVEVCSVFTYHLLWVAVVRHCHEMAPEGLTSTVIALAGGIHYAIGKGSGNLIGGLTMSEYGGRKAYRIIASICAVTATIYCLFLLTRKRLQKSYEVKVIPEKC